MSTQRQAEQRQKTTAAIAAAIAAWGRAPAHVRIMAGDYVEPLLAALVALDMELGARAAQ